MNDELKLEYEHDSYIAERNEYESSLVAERPKTVSRINTYFGSAMFVLALLIGIVLWLIGASGYWWSAIALFGGMGLLLAVFNEIMVEEQEA